MFCSDWNWILPVIGLLAGLILYGKWEEASFKRKGVMCIPTSVPFVGNMLSILLRQEHLKDLIYRTYNAFPDQKYIGFRQFGGALLWIRDLELIKKIAIKDFDHFQDHSILYDSRTDPFFGNNLFTLRGQKWRDMRPTLSPAFTSSKMKIMFEFVTECAEQLANHYVEKSKNEKNNGHSFTEIEAKDMFTRFANDVIANCAFGIKVNSLEDRDNEFYKMGKEITDFSGFRLFKFIPSTAKIMKMLGIPMLNNRIKDFYRTLVQGTMNMRQERNIIRPDMIQLLMEAKKGSLRYIESNEVHIKEESFATVEESSFGKRIVKRDWSDDEITAQAVVFFMAGFDTSATLMCFMAYELTINPGIQKRLQEEIDKTALRNGGKINYSELHRMKYLDMVVCETLRKWPPVLSTDRLCVKPYTLPPPCDSSDREYKLNVNDGVWIPIYGIHHDSKYYENPEKFDPERFYEENKQNVDPFTYMPFGVGPRNCIGSRFALMEAKAVIFYLLGTFDFVQTQNTQVPIQLSTNTIMLQAKDGFWFGLKPRTH